MLYPSGHRVPAALKHPWKVRSTASKRQHAVCARRDVRCAGLPRSCCAALRGGGPPPRDRGPADRGGHHPSNTRGPQHCVPSWHSVGPAGLGLRLSVRLVSGGPVLRPVQRRLVAPLPPHCPAQAPGRAGAAARRVHRPRAGPADLQEGPPLRGDRAAVLLQKGRRVVLPSLRFGDAGVVRGRGLAGPGADSKEVAGVRIGPLPTPSPLPPAPPPLREQHPRQCNGRCCLRNVWDRATVWWSMKIAFFRSFEARDTGQRHHIINHHKASQTGHIGSLDQA